ncbi:L,D-transpeptidase [Mycolicibacterium brumae]|uniref:L,D-TPase catalytic domain-containing protein n=1 Tax=Mycolicibacterium brumae TaxID=85968 RepID=A0A2G5PD35_9MYCO|nr:Ig-like domain-containing protein [Mycolicibacterium brumae]MCV7191390.1 L,D-transpeptidase [Mycolicibacterium brumae]PIB75814.1 hypothetical protein CQY22_008670 [Mycolicibacterium brumae]RWA16102.1 hypothetical protein MBRU_08310 [Mycolicibacterium brumae DSM 44177]UWW09502.1 Ig-like domain-containing protein [Mycolicibacterium brumae]
MVGFGLPRWRNLLTGLALGLAVVLGLSACGPSGPHTIADKGTPFRDLLIPTVTVSVAENAVDVPVNQPLVVTADGGVLEDVSLTTADGTELAGQLSPDGVSWSTTDPLPFREQFTLDAKALGLGGVTERQMAFRTPAPDNVTMPYLSPMDGAVVGVGQPVAVRFDENIPDRKAAEKAITITTDPPVEGAFYWLNNREVRWRPEHYWKPGTTVNVDVLTRGIDLGDGLFGDGDAHSTFTIGDEVIATADDNTKTLTIRRSGEVIKTMPISMGKDSTPTSNGTYIIGDRYAELVMDSSTYGVPVGSPNGYRTEVEYATQMSYSGIYVHAAPWSVGQQGYSNASHGCLNVSTDNARWFYDNTKRGDIVEVVNTVGGTLSGTDGLGDWNIPWSTWGAGNADG